MSPKEAEKFATELALKNGKEAYELVKSEENSLKKEFFQELQRHYR